MLTKNRNPETVGQDHCIRPETLQNSHHFRLSLQNSKSLKTNFYTMNQPQPPVTEVNVPNNTFTNVSLRSNTILNWTAEQTDLVIFAGGLLEHSLSLHGLTLEWKGMLSCWKRRGGAVCPNQGRSNSLEI